MAVGPVFATSLYGDDTPDDGNYVKMVVSVRCRQHQHHTAVLPLRPLGQEHPVDDVFSNWRTGDDLIQF